MFPIDDNRNDDIFTSLNIYAHWVRKERDRRSTTTYVAAELKPRLVLEALDWRRKTPFVFHCRLPLLATPNKGHCCHHPLNSLYYFHFSRRPQIESRSGSLAKTYSQLVPFIQIGSRRIQIRHADLS